VRDRHGPTASPQRTTRPPDPAGLTVFAAVEPDVDGQLLLRELLRLRCIVSHVWPVPNRLPGDVDVILTSFMENLHERLPWMPGEATAALVVLLPPRAGYDVRVLRNCGPDAVLFRPWQAHQIVTSIEMARNQFLYIKRLKMRIGRLDENIRAARDIERAKTILVETRKISEEEAYAFLRTQAMERRISVAALASAFVDSYSLVS
jgi:AmiR/NasT family two-component response regulator